jgi:hypothetical protein
VSKDKHIATILKIAENFQVLFLISLFQLISRIALTCSRIPKSVLNKTGLSTRIFQATGLRFMDKDRALFSCCHYKFGYVEYNTIDSNSQKTNIRDKNLIFPTFKKTKKQSQP